MAQAEEAHPPVSADKAATRIPCSRCRHPLAFHPQDRCRAAGCQAGPGGTACPKYTTEQPQPPGQ